MQHRSRCVNNRCRPAQPRSMLVQSRCRPVPRNQRRLLTWRLPFLAVGGQGRSEPVTVGHFKACKERKARTCRVAMRNMLMRRGTSNIQFPGQGRGDLPTRGNAQMAVPSGWSVSNAHYVLLFFRLWGLALAALLPMSLTGEKHSFFPTTFRHHKQQGSRLLLSSRKLRSELSSR